jgi:Methyltransferase domain
MLTSGREDVTPACAAYNVSENSSVCLLQKVLTAIQCHGVVGTIAVALKRPLKFTPIVRERVRGRPGLEIGGPSPFFRTFLPIYDCIQSLDNCVFASTTIWEGEVKAPFFFHPAKVPGRNYVAEGSDLSQFPNDSYDFLLSCHNLEHIANPIKALREWIRVLRPGGSLVLVVPDGRKTFDWRRLQQR